MKDYQVQWRDSDGNVYCRCFHTMKEAKAFARKTLAGDVVELKVW